MRTQQSLRTVSFLPFGMVIQQAQGQEQGRAGEGHDRRR
jgi:hypothetical protein